MNYFNKLPNELVFIIFNKLSVSDLRSLRVVNKRFKEISEQSVNDLCVLDGITNNVWYQSKELKSPSKDDLVQLDHFSSFRNVFKLEISLKRLELDDYTFDVDGLNVFKNLEHLEIACEIKSDRTLNLPKLRLISIFLSAYDSNLVKFKLRLESKKLQVVCFESSNNSNIVIAHPKQVKHLTLDSKEYDIEQFENLEYLNLFYDSGLDREILSKFKKLKVLEYDGDKDDEEFVNAFNYVLKQRLVQRRSDLVVRLHGIEIENQSIIKDFNKLSIFEFQLKHFDRLTGDLYECVEIHCDEYDTLIRYLGNKASLPSFKQFFNRYFNLTTVYVGNLDESKQDQCRFFLDNLLCLKSLVITDCDFSQSFFDKLADFKYLDFLEIIFQEEEEIEDFYNVHVQAFKTNLNYFKDDKPNDEPIINFDFVTKFKELRILSTQFKLNNPFEMASDLIEQSKRLKTFKFKQKNVFYNVTKQANSLYKVRATRLPFEIYEDDEIIEEEDKDEVFLAFNLNKNELAGLSKIKFPM